MKLFRVSSKKEKDAIDVKSINSFAIVTAHDKDTDDKYFELWFKTNGKENPWNCSIAEEAGNVNSALAMEFGSDAYVTELDVERELLVNLITEVITEKSFLIPLGDRVYTEELSGKTYLLDEINTDEDGVIPEGAKGPSKFFEPIDIMFNPLSFLINNIRPIYDNIDNSLITTDVYIPVSANSNSFNNYDDDEVLDDTIIKHVIYRRHPKGLYYADAISREDGSPNTHIILNGVIDTIEDKLYLKMFSDLRELDDSIDDVFSGEMKLLKLKALIKKTDFDKYQKYISEFTDCNYYKEVPNFEELEDTDDEEERNVRLVNSDQISKLHYKEFRNKEGIKYRLFIDMYKHTDNETVRLYIQIGDEYCEYNQMKDDIASFVNGEFVIEITEHNESEKYKARFIHSTIETDYKEIDLNDFR